MILFQPIEGAAADEQDVGRVDLHEVLVRVLAAALWRHAGDRALDQLSSACWHALARDVGVIDGCRLLREILFDLIDVDDPALRLLDLIAAVLQQFWMMFLERLSDVAASVSVVESAITNGTSAGGPASAPAASLPEPVGRSSGCCSCPARRRPCRQVLQSLVVVVYRDRKGCAWPFPVRSRLVRIEQISLGVGRSTADRCRPLHGPSSRMMSFKGRCTRRR